MKRLSLLAFCLLAACTTTDQANKAVASRYIGTPADAFFIKYGPPSSAYKLQDGSTLFTWSERAKHFDMPTTATTNVYGNTAFTTVNSGGDIMVQCQLKIVGSAGGTITSIAVLNDSIGVWQMSRCNEVFSRKTP